MKRSTAYALTCLVLLAVAGAVMAAGFAFSGASQALAIQFPTEETAPPQVAEVHGYRAWAKVNPQPVYILPKVSALCARAVQPPLPDEAGNPHARKRLTVYVNELGRQAMFSELKPKFPVGSVIVKEKLPPVKDGAPELLTVMSKREQGFNPESGDWEYMVVNGPGTKIEERGKLANCQGCHIPMKETDFIYRNYLPDELRAKLR